MPPFLEHELQNHARALRRLARSLVGDQHADDLVQDAALSALRQTRPPESLRSWLFAVLRRLASRHHRGERRRLQREAAVPPPAMEPAPDRVAEHKDTLQQLTAALVALPEPYQRTLMLRYFEELLPSAIAAQTGVPVATVKTRLQRGIALLRERLDAGEKESDWRAALGALFGLRPAVPIGAATVTVAGVMLMGTGVKLALSGVGAAVAMAAAWWYLQAPPPAIGAVTDSTVSAPQAVQAGSGTDSPATTNAQRTELDLPAAAVTATSPVTVRGRVVDEDRQPIAGAEARFQLFVGSSSELRGTPDKVNAPAHTATDGIFAFSFAAATFDRLQLDVRCDGYCPVNSQLPMTGSGTIDLGDLALATAIHLRGRVVDDQGRTQGGVALRVSEDHTSQGTTSGADGRFETASPLRPGRAWVTVDNRSLAAGSVVELQLDRDHPLVDVDVTVRSDEPGGLAGVVVDETGAPIARAHVRAAAGATGTFTAADGRFALPIPAALGPGPFRLLASADGCDDLAAAPLPRGSNDAKLVLRYGPDLLVRVVATDTQQAVTDFRLLLLSAPPLFAGIRSLSMAHYADGIARVRGAPRGDGGVWVEAQGERLSPSAFMPIHIGDAASTEILVRLEPRSTRLLRVQDVGGHPLAGIEVELIDAASQPLERSTYASLPMQRRFGGALYQAQLLQSGSTDANGELQLHGPGQRPLALRLRGGGVSLQVVPSITLAGPGPLLVTAERGACWCGRLVPDEVARSLLAVLAKEGEGGRLGLRLSRDLETLQAQADPPIPIAADGTFRVDCIPSGTWQVLLRIGSNSWPAARVTVVAGATLQQDLDISPLAPLHLELQTFVDGRPFANGVVDLVCCSAAGATGQPMWSSTPLHTDADGKASADTFPGQFLGHVYLPVDGREAGFITTPPFAIRTAGRAQHVLEISLAGATLQLLRPDGAPAAGVAMCLSFPDFDLRGGARGWTSDAKGRVVLHREAAGNHLMRVRPRSLGAPEAQQAFAQRHGWQALQQAWIDLPPLTLQPGTAAAPIELRLPPEWDR